MAIEGITSRDGIGLTLFVAPSRLDEAAAFYRAVFGAISPRHWINPRTGDVTGIDILIGRATFTVSCANPKRDADPTLPGPCTPSQSCARPHRMPAGATASPPSSIRSATSGRWQPSIAS
jgi:hypothetical protein